MMVMNPGLPCTDTAYMEIMVYNEINVSYTVSEDTMCILDNSFNFVGVNDGPPGTTLTWDFGPNANPSSSNLSTVNNVVYDQSGDFSFTFEASFGEIGRASCRER